MSTDNNAIVAERLRCACKLCGAGFYLGPIMSTNSFGVFSLFIGRLKDCLLLTLMLSNLWTYSVGVQLYPKKRIAIWKTCIASFIEIQLVSVFHSITAPSS